MRVLGPIPHPTYKIMAYTLDRYYYVEIEAGPMKQCYKLHQDSTDGLAGIKKWLDEEFSANLKRVFEDMYRNHKASIERNLSPSGG